MKSKNLVLMVVAVGCGLVAAFLTAKLSGSAATEVVDVIVAKTQLVQGTEIKTDKEGLERQLEIKRFAKGTEPATYVRDVEFLKGKKLNKTLRQGDHFTDADLTNNRGIALPKGHTAMAIKVTAESTAGGLVLPGARVHVVLAENQGASDKTKRSSLVLKDMLVVAVNAVTNRPEGSDSISQPSTVTLAVTPKEGAYLALAQKRGDLSLLLRDPKSPPIKDDEKAASNEEQLDFGAISKLPCDAEEKAAAPPAPEGPQTVEVWVAKEDLAAGTKIEDPNQFFEKTPMLRQPDNAVTDVAQLRGRTLTKPLYKHQFVPLAAFEGTWDEKKPVPVVKAPPTSSLVITNGSNTRSYSYNRETNVLLGVVGPTTAVRPTVEEPKPEAKPEEKPAVKPEGQPEAVPGGPSAK